MTFLGSCPVVAALLMSAATDGIAQTPLAGDWRPRRAAGGPVRRWHPRLARRRPRPYVPRTLKFVTSLLT